jgi:hypothetical protein
VSVGYLECDRPFFLVFTIQKMHAED